MGATAVSYILPPLGFYWQYGPSLEFGVSIPLTLLGWIPGVLYAVVMFDKDVPVSGNLQPGLGFGDSDVGFTDDEDEPHQRRNSVAAEGHEEDLRNWRRPVYDKEESTRARLRELLS